MWILVFSARSAAVAMNFTQTAFGRLGPWYSALFEESPSTRLPEEWARLTLKVLYAALAVVLLSVAVGFVAGVDSTAHTYTHGASWMALAVALGFVLKTMVAEYQSPD